MSLGLGVAAIDFDRVTHRLKGMKRKTNRKKNTQTLEGVVPVNRSGQLIQIIIEEIEVLENEENADVRNQTDSEQQLSAFPVSAFNWKPSEKIDEDCEAQNEYISGNKRHVE